MRSLKMEIDQVRDALEEGQDLAVVHYACESFQDAKDHPPAVAAISIYDLRMNSITTYSRSDAPPDLREDSEVDLLRRFYSDLGARRDSQILHWNMSRPEYGFDALAARYRYLTREYPQNITQPSRRYDVDALLTDQYGENYAPHGKLESTAKLNRLDVRSFKDGFTESELFKEKDWASISRSVSSKAKIIGEIAKLLIAGKVRTTHSAGQLQFAESRLDAVGVVLDVGQRFLLVQRSLMKHPHGGDTVKFNNEWDDQYIFRALLSLFFDDIREEDPVPTEAGAASRIDFVLADFQLAVELKHTRPGLDDKELGVQLSTDTTRYGARTDITHLICLVFDYSGHIRNPRALEKDLSKSHSAPGLTVSICIYDR